MTSKITRVLLERNMAGCVIVLFEDGRRVETEYTSYYGALRSVKSSDQEIFWLMTSEQLELAVNNQIKLEDDIVYLHAFKNGVSLTITAECDPENNEDIPHLKLQATLDTWTGNRSATFSSPQYFELSHHGYVRALNCLEEYVRDYSGDSRNTSGYVYHGNAAGVSVINLDHYLYALNPLIKQNAYSGRITLNEIASILQMRHSKLGEHTLTAIEYRRHSPTVPRDGLVATYTRKIRDKEGEYKYHIHIDQYDFKQFQKSMDLPYKYRFSARVSFENPKHGMGMNITFNLEDNVGALLDVEEAIEHTYQMLGCTPNFD